MKQTLLILVVTIGLNAGCRKPRPAPVTPSEPAPAPTTEAVTPVPGGAPAASPAPPVNIPLLETSVEFSDLNGLVGGFYEKHKRLPSIPELTKLYYKPIPVPPGYRLVIDPQSKQVKAVR